MADHQIFTRNLELFALGEATVTKCRQPVTRLKNLCGWLEPADIILYKITNQNINFKDFKGE